VTPDQEQLARALDAAERLRDTCARAVDRLGNIARLHAADTRLGGDCRECFQPWPCRTIGAAVGALPDEEYPR
jgi:hypothetical protein